MMWLVENLIHLYTREEASSGEKNLAESIRFEKLTRKSFEKGWIIVTDKPPSRDCESQPQHYVSHRPKEDKEQRHHRL